MTTVITKPLLPSDFIRAELGDKLAVRKILEYVHLCGESDIQLDQAVVSYLGRAFSRYLSGQSLNRAFCLTKDKGRQSEDNEDRDFLITLEVMGLTKKLKREDNFESLEKSVFPVISRKYSKGDETVRKIYKKNKVLLDEGEVEGFYEQVLELTDR